MSEVLNGQHYQHEELRMADRFGGSNALIAMALGAILALLVIFLFFGGSGIFGANDPADVEVQLAPDAPELPVE